MSFDTNVLVVDQHSRIEERVNYNCDIIDRPSSTKIDFISSLKELSKLLQHERFQPLVSRVILERKVIFLICKLLERITTDVIHFHTRDSTELAELCLSVLRFVIPKLGAKQVTEKRFGGTIVNILQLLGFGETFENCKFKHSFPNETLEYLKNETEGKAFKGKLLKLDAAEKLKLKQQFIFFNSCNNADSISTYEADLLDVCDGANLTDILANKSLAAKCKETRKKRPSVTADVRLMAWEAENLCWVHILSEKQTIYLDMLKSLFLMGMAPLKVEPERGQIVCARYDGPHWIGRCWIRGLVLAARENVQLFAIDYGFLHDAHWSKLYYLPKSEEEIPCLAVACRLRHLTPPLPSRNIVEHGLEVMNALCNINSDVVGNMILKSKNISVILHLLGNQFGNAEHLLGMLSKICQANSDVFLHTLLGNHGFSKICDYFRYLHSLWEVNNTAYHENCLLLCCKMLHCLVNCKDEGTNWVDIANIESLSKLEDLPSSCKDALFGILSQSHPERGSQNGGYAQGDIFESVIHENHMTIDSRCLGDVDYAKLEEKICALANHQKGGKITLGVACSGQIVGMHLSQKKRDTFRLGIDELTMRKIRPPLTPARCALGFVPVAGSSNDLFLADLEIKGAPFGLHSTQDGRYMVYFGPRHVREMFPDELKDSVVAHEEKKYLKEIEMLRAAIAKLRGAST